MKVCYIPARSGSKGLIDKNIKLLGGVPLLIHTISAAKDSELFELENIFVSTDSEEYAKIAKETGVSVLMREKELASDTTTTYELLESLLAKNDDVIDFILLQPTSPFRTGVHVKEAWETYENTKSTVLSVSKLEVPSNLLTKLDSENNIKDIIGLDKQYTRQNKKGRELYYPNGAIYISNKQTYLKEKSFYLADTKAYIMDKYSSVDIDDIDDFEYAEYVLNKKQR